MTPLGQRYGFRTMWFMVVAIAAGVLAGRLRGGHLAGVTGHGVRWLSLLLLGVALQLAPEALGTEGASPLLLGSFLLLAAFAAGNRHLVGMPIFLLGLGLNLVVVAVNDGMPVRPEAVVAANIATVEQLPSLDLGARRHLETPADDLTVLGDIIAVPPLREVMSFGDLIMAVGVADIVANLMLPRRRRHLPGEAITLDRTGGADWIDLREQERLAKTTAGAPGAPVSRAASRLAADPAAIGSR